MFSLTTINAREKRKEDPQRRLGTILTLLAILHVDLLGQLFKTFFLTASQEKQYKRATNNALIQKGSVGGYFSDVVRGSDIPRLHGFL